jgi:phenylacetate-CoA ligase
MIHISSGSSGRPTFWARDAVQEEAGGKLHRYILDNVFNIKKNDTTLVVICFSMGVWVAGGYTLAAFRWLSKNGYNISTVTPAMEREDIINIFKNLAPSYKNLIIVGYPPFIMDVVNGAIGDGVRFSQCVKILTAGDKFTEKWRDALAKLLGIHHSSIVSVYGSADALALGHETPLSIYIRREALKDSNIYKDLFGEEKNIPAIVQFHEDMVHIEEIKGELIITAPLKIPLIRYNIHDRGVVIQSSDMLQLLNKHGIKKDILPTKTRLFNHPFLVLKGRSDVAVTFYAINIYPEHIMAGLIDKPIARYTTGSFITHNSDYSKGKSQKLNIEIELASNIKDSTLLRLNLNKRFKLNLNKRLIEHNIEYRKLFFSIGERAMPRVRLVRFGSLRPKRGVVFIQGKKAKIVL